MLLSSILIAQSVCAEVVDVGMKEFQRLLESGVTVIDVRTPDEWQQTGIVEDSIPIMFFDNKRKSHAQEWMRKAADYISPDRELVLICRTGNRSKVVGNYLAKQFGYARVYNVKGGITQWLRAGKTTVRP